MSYSSRLALIVALLIPPIVLGGGSLIFLTLTWNTPPGDELFRSASVLGFVAVAFVGGLAGAVIALRRPENLMGWLFIGFGTFALLDSFYSRYLLYTLSENPSSGLPSLTLFAGAVSVLWIGPVACTALLLLLFPQGRPMSPQWRLAAWLIVLLAVLVVVFPLLKPGPLVSPFEKHDNDLGVGIFKDLEGLAHFPSLVMGVIALIGAVSLFRRFIKSTGDERQQMKWFAYSAVWIPPILIFYSIYVIFVSTSGPVIDVLNTSLAVVLMTLPVAVGIAILKYRLYDIDLLVNRTLVYIPLTAIVAGFYTAISTLTRTIFTEFSGQASDISVAVSTLTIFALFTPVKNHLQSVVDRVFKEASDPAKPLLALSADARKVFKVLDTEGFLQEFADRAAAALAASNALIYLNGEATPVIVSGEPVVECVLCFPLVESGTHVGRLEIGPSKAFRPFAPREVAALEKQTDVLARGLVFHAAALGLELKRPDQDGPGAGRTVGDELGVL